MVNFSTNLKRSKQPRKQRTYVYSAPLHIRQKFTGAHLSKELKEKYGKRSVTLRTGDKVKIMRGQFKGKNGTVEKIDLKKTKAIITGIELTKKDGSKVQYPITISNVMITELKLEDKKRKKQLENKNEQETPKKN
jgi:large subunit ribosomal protein L24|tara:strand:+ start:111 stop:515 length:405 start_codon:yes stop_codon:yes gene_type:complete